MTSRQLISTVLALALLAPGVIVLSAGPAALAAPHAFPQQITTAGQAISRDEAIRQLALVRASIDQTLELIKQERPEEARAQAKVGYLNHFEHVETLLRVVDPELTADAETKFVEIRRLIGDQAPLGEVRGHIVELRRMLDDTERRLTDIGPAAAAMVAGQSFLIIFREGLEAVLLLIVLLGYLEATKSTRYRKPVIWGVLLGLAATALTYLLLRSVLALVPVGRELLAAVLAIAAVAVLLHISFCLIARSRHRRWMDLLRSRLFSAVSIGSTTALVGVGCTAMYRTGLETALFYQVLADLGAGMGRWIVVGLAAGLAVLAAVAGVVFMMGRWLPVRVFLVGAVVLLMASSVAFLGNAVRALQAADLIGLTPIDTLPSAPIFLAQALGYWPSVQTLVAQVSLVALYLLTATWLSMVRPRTRVGG